MQHRRSYNQFATTVTRDRTAASWDRTLPACDSPVCGVSSSTRQPCGQSESILCPDRLQSSLVQSSLRGATPVSHSSDSTTRCENVYPCLLFSTLLNLITLFGAFVFARQARPALRSPISPGVGLNK